MPACSAYRRLRTGVLAAAGALVLACTTTSVREQARRSTAEELRIGEVVIKIDEAAVEADRAQRLREIGTPEAVVRKLNEYLDAAGFLGGELDLAVTLNAFRLPRGARWITGGMKGNDVLGASIAVRRGETAVYAADVEVQLGAGDRSVGANYSADWAHDSLVDMLAWEIAWTLTGVADRRGEDAVLEAGKRDSVKHAILVLAHRGRLSYGEYLKYAALGKIGVENTALAAKYDACGARKLLTLGLSECRWDPDYR